MTPARAAGLIAAGYSRADLPHFIGLRGDDHCVATVRSRLRGPVVFCATEHAHRSSTKVRHALAHGETLDLDDELRRFVHEQRLFGCSPSAAAPRAPNPAGTAASVPAAQVR